MKFVIVFLIFVAFISANSRIVKRQKGPYIAPKNEKQPQPKGKNAIFKLEPPHINPAQSPHVPENGPDSLSKESAIKRRTPKRPSSDNFTHRKLHKVENPNLKIENEYIVVLKKDANEESVMAMVSHFTNKKRGITVKSKFTKVLKGITVSMPIDALKEILDYDEVAYIAENGIVKIQQSVSDLWGLDRIDQRDLPLGNTAYTPPGNQGDGVKIYVVDTGIRYSHQEFDDRAKFFFDAFGGNTGNDCHGHGTHCAGTAAGKFVGVARKAEILVVRVLDCDGYGTNEGVIAGLEAIADGETGVVSMSLGGGEYTPINEAADSLVEKGFVVAVAAGNEYGDACSYSPSSASEVITVGSTTRTDAISDFSNTGPCVNILAPGSDIYSSTMGSDSEYQTWSGTSMATPHVAGAAAVLWSNNAGYSGQDVKNYILDNASCNRITGLGTDTVNRLFYYSGGAIDNPDTCTPPEVVCGCSNTCRWANDGMCDDGGSCAAYDLCGYGSDCADCGIRLDECPDDYVPPSEPKECTDCDFTFCQDYCGEYSNNEICEDGGVGSGNENLCTYGTDCTDCGRRPAIPLNSCDQYYCEIDDVCQDGGPNGEPAVCAYGYDCDDCGPRDPPISENPNCDSPVNPPTERPINPPTESPVNPATTMGPITTPKMPTTLHNNPTTRESNPTQPPVDSQCSAEFYQCDNFCYYKNDGDCDDGGPGSVYDVCAYGTDFNDCGPRPIKDSVLCTEECSYSGDSDCDDGGPGSDYNVCSYGTDCLDCGEREITQAYCIGDMGICSDGCATSNNGICEDGLMGSRSGSCLQGTDCTDCRSRYLCLF